MIRKILLYTIALICINTVAISAPSISVTTLEDAIAMSEDTGHKILAIFGAEWCVYCEKSKDEIAKNIDNYQDIIIVYLNIDDRPDLKKEYRVQKIPDYMILKDRKETKRHVGYLSQTKLLEFIQ